MEQVKTPCPPPRLFFFFTIIKAEGPPAHTLQAFHSFHHLDSVCWLQNATRRTRLAVLFLHSFSCLIAKFKCSHVQPNVSAATSEAIFDNFFFFFSVLVHSGHPLPSPALYLY